jgi:monovalent cation/hydrogen antiporter
VIYLTFDVILATQVIQGLSLPLLIRGLGLHDDGASEREEMKVRLTAAQASLARLDAFAGEDEVSHQLAQHLRRHYTARIRSNTKRFKQTTDEPGPNCSLPDSY